MNFLFDFILPPEQEAQEQAKKEKEATMQQTPDYAAALMSPAVNVSKHN